MFGFLKGKKSDKELMIEEFQKVITFYNGQDETGKAAIEHGLAFCWKTFNAKFGSVEGFKAETQNVKSGYIAKLTEFEEKSVKEGYSGVALGAALLKMYLAPVIEGDRILEK